MCVDSIMKIVVFVVNFVFSLVGIALIIVGSIYVSNTNGFSDAIPEEFSNMKIAPILTIVVGSIIFLIAFFGCFGVCTSSSCLLTTYAVILLVLFLMQIGIGIFAFVEINDKNELEKGINKSMANLFSHYTKNKEVVDLIQTELKCCGLNGTSYWGNNIPDSCCEDENEHKTCSHYNEDSCPKEFYTWLNHSMKTIGIVVLCLAVTEVIGCIFSLCMANSIRNKARRGVY